MDASHADGDRATAPTLGDRLRVGAHALVSGAVIIALGLAALTAFVVWFDPPAIAVFLWICAIPFVGRAYWHYAGIRRFPFI